NDDRIWRGVIVIEAVLEQFIIGISMNRERIVSKNVRRKIYVCIHHAVRLVRAEGTGVALREKRKGFGALIRFVGKQDRVIPGWKFRRHSSCAKVGDLPTDWNRLARKTIGHRLNTHDLEIRRRRKLDFKDL